MTRFEPPSREILAWLQAEGERTLTAEEFDAWVSAPWSPEDLEDTLEHIRWFQRRYPTAAGRLAAGRAAYKRARALMPR